MVVSLASNDRVVDFLLDYPLAETTGKQHVHLICSPLIASNKASAWQPLQLIQLHTKRIVACRSIGMGAKARTVQGKQGQQKTQSNLLKQGQKFSEQPFPSSLPWLSHHVLASRSTTLIIPKDACKSNFNPKKHNLNLRRTCALKAYNPTPKP